MLPWKYEISIESASCFISAPKEHNAELILPEHSGFGHHAESMLPENSTLAVMLN